MKPVRPVCPTKRALGPASAEIAEMIQRAPALRFDLAWRRAIQDDRRLMRLHLRAARKSKFDLVPDGL